MVFLNQLLQSCHLTVSSQNPRITGLAIDSRKVKPGFLFAAVPGEKTDGRLFIPKALELGATAILAPLGTTIPNNTNAILITTENPRQTLAKMASVFFEKQPNFLIAVTGTNGKTSTVDFIRQLWSLQGYQAASIGTLGVISPIPVQFEGPVLTTLDSITLHQILAQLQKSDVNHVALEASSHGLAQYRLDGLEIHAAGFSNLTRDHLDYHHDFAHYLEAKLRLFKDILPQGGIAAVNADMDPDALKALKDVAKKRNLALRLVGEKGSFLKLLSVTPHIDGQHFKIAIGNEQYDVAFPLLGRYQIDNILLALALIAKNEAEIPHLLSLLPQLKGVRGRMEKAVTLSNGGAVYVDYAHTPDAIAHVLQSLRPHCKNRLFVLFGAGGDRDRGKRPLMAQQAALFADQVIVTDDNPRTEAANLIRQEVMAGDPKAIEIAGRSEAIAFALKQIKEGDILVVAGKGHEQGQIIGKEVHPFDDVSVIRDLAGNL